MWPRSRRRELREFHAQVGAQRAAVGELRRDSAERTRAWRDCLPTADLAAGDFRRPRWEGESS